MPTAPVTPSPNLTIEAIVAVDAPREFRLHPRDRQVAFTAEAAGARQLFTLALRGGYPNQLTASEKPVSDPQWSPDGRRLAFVRDDEIWVIEADGSRLTRVVGKPGAGREPRWSPDGHRLAFLLAPPRLVPGLAVDAPCRAAAGPRRSRSRREPTVLTATGFDVEDFEWSPDGQRIAVMARAARLSRRPRRSHLVDVATGAERGWPAAKEWASRPRWLPGRLFLYLSDADGWFQVVRLAADGHERTVLTDGRARARRAERRLRRTRRCPSPDGSRFVHIEVHDGLVDLVVAPSWRRRAAEARPRPAAEDAADRRRPPAPATRSTRGPASGARSAG